MPAPKDPIKREEWIENMRRARLGKPSGMLGKHCSEDTKKKMSESKKGVPKSEEHKRKVSIALTGKKLSPDHCKNIGLSKKGQIPWNKGLAGHLSEATLKQLSESEKNKPPITEETRIKMSKAVIGAKNPMFGKTKELSSNWKGGVSFQPYCEKFNDKFKERVRAFFNYTCVECGRVWKHGEKRRFDVHHVNFRKDSCCNENVRPLFVLMCPSCHSRTGGNREFWEDWFTDIIDEFYNGKCYFTEKEMGDFLQNEK